MRRRSLVFGLLLGASLLTAAARPVFGDFIVTDLGTLGGAGSNAFGLNDSGQVVGASQTGAGTYPRHAFLYDIATSTMTDLGTLGGNVSVAVDINNAGQIVGRSRLGGTAYPRHAFLYDIASGTMTDLGDFYNQDNSTASAINESGQVVGSAFAGSDLAIGFLSDPAGGTMQPLIPPPGGWHSVGQAINETGLLVGTTEINGPYQPPNKVRYNDLRAFVYDIASDSMTVLSTFGGNDSNAQDINNSGQVVGFAETTSGEVHAMLYDIASATMTDLGTLGGAVSFAKAINEAGQIVGFSDTGSGTPHPFLYENGTMIDLNSVLSSGSGWELLTAQDINNHGQIVGVGMHNGKKRAFLLSPTAVPEPSSLILLGTGLVGLLGYGRRRKRRGISTVAA